MSTPKAIRNTLILKTLTADSMTASGLHIPDMAQRLKNRAEVVSIGGDCTADVSVGDIVIYERGMPLTVDEVAYIRVNERDLVAVVEPDATLAAAA